MRIGFVVFAIMLALGIALSGHHVLAGVTLDSSDMSKMFGGCAKCSLDTGTCGITCNAGWCDCVIILGVVIHCPTYADGGSLSTSVCDAQKSRAGQVCTPKPTVLAGCGDYRHGGDCISGFCKNGTKTGVKDRDQVLSGDPCPS